jgi:hypothetical protein
MTQPRTPNWSRQASPNSTPPRTAAGHADYLSIGWEEDRVEGPQAIEGSVFFQTVRAGLVTGLYNQKALWPIFGYEGESFSLRAATSTAALTTSTGCKGGGPMVAKFDLNDDSVVVIIGTGAGGGVLANELAQKGVKVVALEAGRALSARGLHQRRMGKLLPACMA